MANRSKNNDNSENRTDEHDDGSIPPKDHIDSKLKQEVNIMVNNDDIDGLLDFLEDKPKSKAKTKKKKKQKDTSVDKIQGKADSKTPPTPRRNEREKSKDKNKKDKKQLTKKPQQQHLNTENASKNSSNS